MKIFDLIEAFQRLLLARIAEYNLGSPPALSSDQLATLLELFSKLDRYDAASLAMRHTGAKAGNRLYETKREQFCLALPEELRPFFVEAQTMGRVIAEAGCYTLNDARWWDPPQVPLQRRILAVRPLPSVDTASETARRAMLSPGTARIGP